MTAADRKSLQKRYCLWLYKTTREALDRIERKFTQLEVDRALLGQLRKSAGASRLTQQIADFERYLNDKEVAARALKWDEAGALRGEYEFLVVKLDAVEAVTRAKFGPAALARIKAAYEQEMAGRILAEREQKV